MTVSKDDLEAKLREIEGVVSETEREMRDSGMLLVAGVAAVVVIAIVWTIWSRRRRGGVVVEVYQQ